MGFLDDMRQRPEEERLAFAAGSAVAVAFVLFVLWGATFAWRMTLSSATTAAPASQLAAPAARDAGTLGVVRDDGARDIDVSSDIIDESARGATVRVYVDEFGEVTVESGTGVDERAPVRE